jgi:hypothetical protein
MYTELLLKYGIQAHAIDVKWKLIVHVLYSVVDPDPHQFAKSDQKLSFTRARIERGKDIFLIYFRLKGTGT